jgi:flagellar biosynthesis protein FliQ
VNELLIVDLASSAIRTAFLVAAPALILGLVVGLAVSLFQAVTSIQDPTLSFVPKILAIMLIVLLAFPWMISIMKDFTEGIFNNINYYIR